MRASGAPKERRPRATQQGEAATVVVQRAAHDSAVTLLTACQYTIPSQRAPDSELLDDRFRGEHAALTSNLRTWSTRSVHANHRARRIAGAHPVDVQRAQAPSPR